jgi:hypothetical protein
VPQVQAPEPADTNLLPPCTIRAKSGAGICERSRGG